MLKVTKLINGQNADYELLYIRLGRLIASMPNLENIELTAETHKWLGEAYALVDASGKLMAPIQLQTEITTLTTHAGHQGASVQQRQTAARRIQTILYQSLAVLELKAPASVQGSFILSGNSFDAFSVIATVFNKATNDILIIDPYLDNKVLTEFAATAPESVSIRLLTDETDHKTSLKPAYNKWITQFGDSRPLQLRFLPHRAIHDRLIIIDNSEVWDLTQSLNAFASRSPASVVRFSEPDIKINAYTDMWNKAKPLE